MPRINRAIELLSQDQPIYYNSTHDLSFESGKAAANTWADFINIDMEHHPFDVAGLSKFMEGLVAGGPTKSGHRTPAVIAVVPITARDASAMMANIWMMTQVLTCGVHGILMTHANDPAAVRIFVEACRYPFNRLGVGAGLNEGLRGSAGQAHAAEIWGVSVPEYLKKADPWPLNPEGELLLGLKIENRFALQQAEITAKIPGIAFAEWGPGDMGMSLGLPDGHGANETLHPQMRDARATVLGVCKKNKIAFLNTVRVNDVEEMIKEGVMICAGGGPEAADKGRRFTKRQMPW